MSYTADTPIAEVTAAGSAAHVALIQDMHIATFGELAAADAGLLHHAIVARGISQKTAIQTVRRMGAILREGDIRPRSISWLSSC